MKYRISFVFQQLVMQVEIFLKSLPMGPSSYMGAELFSKKNVFISSVTLFNWVKWCMFYPRPCSAMETTTSNAFAIYMNVLCALSL